MALLKLRPTYQSYIWGGRRLIDEYGKDFDGDVLAESWELSAYPGAESTIIASSREPEAAGEALGAYIARVGRRETLGSACERFFDFPVLIKLIDAKQNLSIQVHPSDEYAREHEGQYGKTEMWVILDAAEGAFIYYGFDRPVSGEEFERRISENTLEEVLHRVNVKAGDVFFIPSGTLHAIGEGCLIAEIQQSSNVTYRIYDYGRIGADGKPRELHIEKALEVTRREPVSGLPDMGGHLGRCEYFTVDEVDITGRESVGVVDATSFKHLLFVDGAGSIRFRGRDYSYKKGDSFLFTAGSGEYALTGSGRAIVTYEE